MESVRTLAGMIDHSLLHPTLTDEQLEAGCALAKRYATASVCIKPYAVPRAAEWLEGSVVRVGTVIGFPHGNASLDIKVNETERACRDGAVEVDMVVNIGRVLGEDWAYADREIRAVLAACRDRRAVLKVIFENDYLKEDRFKIRLCEICREAGADYVKTSTGYAFVKDTDGRWVSRGAADGDLKLMLRHAGPAMKVKAAGGIRTLDDLLRVRALGVSRVGASATESILKEARERFGTDPP
ncbi:MAG TPA: deoxyribose-phosphate aldolase [bacterium]|nr:deoxyribose-phosphate aldolase [bacterium]